MNPKLITLFAVTVRAASLLGGNNPATGGLVFSEIENDSELYKRRPLDLSDRDLQEDLEWALQESNKENKENSRFPILGRMRRGMSGLLKRGRNEIIIEGQEADFPELEDARPIGDAFNPRKSAKSHINEAKPMEFQKLDTEMQKYLSGNLMFGIPSDKKGVFSWLYHLARTGGLEAAVPEKSIPFLQRFIHSNMQKHRAKYNEIKDDFEMNSRQNEGLLAKFEKLKRRLRPDVSELESLKTAYEAGIQITKDLAELATKEAKMYASYKLIQQELNKIPANKQ